MSASKDVKTPAPARWPLLRGGYAKATTDKYHRAVKDFSTWCATAHENPNDPDELDDTLADYFHDMYDNKHGKGKQKARDTLYGIEMYLPRLKGKLLVSARIVARWGKMQPAESYPPLTWDLAVLIGVQLARTGRRRFGVGTLLAFHCLLRNSELTALRREDVAFPDDARMGAEYKVTTLAIRKAKTGTNQSVTVLDPDVIALLRTVVATTKPKALLFPGGSAQFRAAFKITCAAVGLSSKYVPHSLRHGGATRLHLQGVPLEDIMLRGRWAASKSARTYIQSSRAVLMAQKTPKALAATAAALAASVAFSFALTQSH